MFEMCCRHEYGHAPIRAYGEWLGRGALHDGFEGLDDRPDASSSAPCTGLEQGVTVDSMLTGIDKGVVYSGAKDATFAML